MKLRREARTLKVKALASFRRGVASFNSFDDEGRVTTILLHFQHACEMLLKAMLVQKRISQSGKPPGSAGETVVV